MSKPKKSTVASVDTPIMLTNSYDSFTRMPGNRKVQPSLVKRLIHSFSVSNNKDLIMSRPVIVNEDYQVLDGQHRLEALKELGLPVPYLIVKNAGIEQVREINFAQRDWKLIDYVDSFIEKDTPHYQTLLDFSQKHNIPLTMAATLLLGERSNRDNNAIRSIIKSGIFEVRDLNGAEQIMDRVHLFKPFCHPIVWKGARFIKIITDLNKHGIDWDRMAEKLQTSPVRIVYTSQESEYLFALEQIYNHNVGRGTKVRLYN